MPSPVTDSLFHSHMLYMIQFDHFITRFLLSISPSCHIFDEKIEGCVGSGIPVYRIYLSGNLTCCVITLLLTKKSYLLVYLVLNLSPSCYL